MRQRARIGFIAAALAIALGACGSASKNADKPASDATTTTKASGHAHDASSMDHSAGSGHDMANMHAVVPEAIPTTADGLLDATKVDLGGIPGVTAAEQRRAENVLKITIEKLPKWANREDAIADGFKSIGDGVTGTEHLIHWDWIDDDRMFDPTQPESLVYSWSTGKPVLEAAMYLVPKQYTLEHPPELGGQLTQFHIHDNLCFTPGDTPMVAGLTQGDGSCRPPLVKFHPNLMVHVWIRANPCGPFAALEGVGAGQVKPGDTKACDHKHGSTASL